MIDFDKINKLLTSNNSFVITTHVNPDADAIGSEIALKIYLDSLGKQSDIINYSKTPDNLSFIDDEKKIKTFDENKHADLISSTDVIILIDSNHLNRTISMENFIRKSNSVKMCIDHHESPEDFTEHLFVDASYTSTGEIIFELISNGNKSVLSYNIALPIYAAIMTDTGSFRFERTSPKTHRIAAQLLETGIDPREVHSQIFEQGSEGSLRLLGRALNSVKLNATREIAYMSLTRKDLSQTGTTEEDIEGFVNFCLSIKGVKIGLLFYELDGGFKVSFRSVGKIPINKLAAEFGGGGHYHAAGTRINGQNMNESLPKIILSAENYLK